MRDLSPSFLNMPLSLTGKYEYRDEVLHFEAADYANNKRYYALEKSALANLSVDAAEDIESDSLDADSLDADALNGSRHHGCGKSVCLQVTQREDGLTYFKTVDEQHGDKGYSLDSANVSELVDKFANLAGYITERRYPGLAEVWDNEEDAVYDEIPEDEFHAIYD